MPTSRLRKALHRSIIAAQARQEPRRQRTKKVAQGSDEQQNVIEEIPPALFRIVGTERDFM
jgi:hypothetical protein